MAGDNFFYSSLVAAAFHAFDAQHIITLIAIVTLCFFVAWAAKNLSSSHRNWLGRAIGFLLVGYAACFYVQQGIAGSLSWEYSLPLDLCNLVLIACIVALFKPSRVASEIAYFWGLGGVLQAAVTPDIAQGFPSWDFILLFWGHGATLLAIVFLTAGRNFRPARRGILRMMVALNVYALVVGFIDAVTGWNYGYLCRKPLAPSLLDYVGPWPWYLLSLEFIALLTFLLLYLPWRLLAARSGAGNC
jgi:hypothetical integral membrane protein (TIGR02206 family)